MSIFKILHNDDNNTDFLINTNKIEECYKDNDNQSRIFIKFFNDDILTSAIIKNDDYKKILPKNLNRINEEYLRGVSLSLHRLIFNNATVPEILDIEINSIDVITGTSNGSHICSCGIDVRESLYDISSMIDKAILGVGIHDNKISVSRFINMRSQNINGEINKSTKRLLDMNMECIKDIQKAFSEIITIKIPVFIYNYTLGKQYFRIDTGNTIDNIPSIQISEYDLMKELLDFNYKYNISYGNENPYNILHGFSFADIVRFVITDCVKDLYEYGYKIFATEKTNDKKSIIITIMIGEDESKTFSSIVSDLCYQLCKDDTYFWRFISGTSGLSRKNIECDDNL